MKIPEDQIFDRPEREEGDESRKRLVRPVARIRNENVEPEQDEQKKGKQMKQDQHGSSVVAARVECNRNSSAIDPEFQRRTIQRSPSWTA